MKLRVEHIKLKSLITEATYQEAFNKIKKGDTLVVKTGDKVWNAKIIDVYGNQIRFEYGGETFIITNTSFEGNTLNTTFVYKNPKTGEEKTTAGPKAKGVYGMVIKRGNQIITSVTPESGRPEKQAKSQEKAKDKSEQRREELVSVLRDADVDDILELTTGKLITKGRDKGSLAKNTVTTIEFIVKKVNNDNVFTKVLDAEGVDAEKYKNMEKYTIVFDAGSFTFTNEMIIATVKYRDPKVGGYKKHQIKNVFGFENKGVSEIDEPYKLTNQEKLDIVKSSPLLRKRYLANPSFMDKLFARDISAPGDINKLFGVLGSPLDKLKPDTWVNFIYYGKGIDIPNVRDLKFKRGETYKGKYIGNNQIIVKSSNRNDSVTFSTVGNPDSHDFITANVTHDYKHLNIPKKRELNRGKIKIKELQKKNYFK